MPDKDVARLHRVHNCLARGVIKAPRFSRSISILKRLHWLPVKFRIHFKICATTFRTLKDNQPAYLADLLVLPKCSKYLRSTNSNRFVAPRIKTKTGSRAFSISDPALRNALPVLIRNAKTILTFWKLLKSHLFDLAFHTLVPQRPGRGPRVVVSTAAFHARVRASFPGFGGLKETKLYIAAFFENVCI